MRFIIFIILMGLAVLFMGFLVGANQMTGDICQQAYASKVSQQITACKHWEDNIDKMKEGK